MKCKRDIVYYIKRSLDDAINTAATTLAYRLHSRV